MSRRARPPGQAECGKIMRRCLLEKCGNEKNVLIFGLSSAILFIGGSHERPHGDIAQLGERLVRNQEVRGSIPLISTICNDEKS